jgi:hypothetical protein
MEKRELIEGDVVQLNPDHAKFPGLLVVVTEPKSWGCQGYLLHQEDFEAVRYKGKAFVRPTWTDMEYVGRLHWMLEYKEENEEEA